MDHFQQKRLKDLRSELDRNNKLIKLHEKLSKVISPAYFSLLPNSSDNPLEQIIKSWPGDKWEQNLYFQRPIYSPGEITFLISNFIRLNSEETVLVLFSNYNFGFVELKKFTLELHWQDFIEVDGDEIFCRIPGQLDFLCIEKTEDFIKGSEIEGRQWIYEVTFFNNGS